MDHVDAGLFKLQCVVCLHLSWTPQGKKGRVHSRRQKGQQGAGKGQQGVAPCYLHLAGPLCIYIKTW